MLASALNFAIGFFGWPLDGQYQQSITIEADGVRQIVLAPLYVPDLCIPTVQQYSCSIQDVRAVDPTLLMLRLMRT